MRIHITSIVVLWASAAFAQQTVAPTPETAGLARGENRGDYNVVDSVEVGYRSASIAGSLPQYRSSVNYGNGVRLLASYLSINSRDGHGKLFDQIVITTQGLGNDPYESATFRVQKNKLYRYDGSWRLNDYFNPGLTSDGATGQHFLNTRYQLQDHDLTLFPDSNLKFFVGYTGSSQTGPAFSSDLLFDSRGAIYPVFADVKRVRHEFRVGNEFRVLGVRVNWMHGWDNFREDTGATLTTAGIPGVVTAVPGLTAYRNASPYHGNSPYWRVALFAERTWISLNGRFTYTSGGRNFVVDESAAGPDRFGSAVNRQVVTYGTGGRPVATGNLNVSVFATSKLTLTNSTAIYNLRTQGDSYFAQYDNSTQSVDYFNFNYLGIRTFANEASLNYQFSPLAGAFAGYQYSNRRISSVEQVTLSGSADTIRYDQTNQLQVGRLGFRLRPLKPLSILVSGEIGRNDQPFTSIADRNYHALNGRVQYRTKSLLLACGAETLYNANSVALSAYSSQSRKYFASGSWTPRSWVSFDGTFSRQHLYTVGGIAYFANFNLVQGEQSTYLSNINSVVVGARFAIRDRVNVYAGFTRVRDAGDGRATLYGSAAGSTLAAFQAAQTFPILFDSPMLRASVRITPKLRLNVGYQYYGYRQDFYRDQGFRANTGYTSVTFSF